MNNMQSFEGFDFKPNDIEDEFFLSEISLNLMRENLLYQFKNPSENHSTDLVQSFINKYIYSKDNELTEEEDDIDGMHDEFVIFMEKTFKEFLGIGFPNLDDASYEEQEELIHFAYRFFIINIKKNFVKFITTYIEKNYDTLAESMEKRKDVAYMTYKKNGVDDNDITILTNIFTIIDNVFKEEFTIDDFFSYIDPYDDILEVSYILDKYDKFEITGNFIENYFAMVDDNLKDEIGCKVKNKLLKKYRKDNIDE